jgi:type VI secretion system FHA domain protein
MTLVLNVLSTDQYTPRHSIHYEFRQESGSIGRGQGNSWVLPDEQKYLSGQHATVEYRDTQYILTDTSTNGVFVNRADQALGKGFSTSLNDGDILRMGIYEISVSISISSDSSHSITNDPFTDQQTDSYHSDSSSGIDDPFANQQVDAYSNDDPFSKQSAHSYNDKAILSDDPFSDISDEFSNNNAITPQSENIEDDPFGDMWQDDYLSGTASSDKPSSIPTGDIIDDNFTPPAIKPPLEKVPKPVPRPEDRVESSEQSKDQTWNDNFFEQDRAKKDHSSKSQASKSEHSEEQWDENWFNQDIAKSSIVDVDTDKSESNFNNLFEGLSESPPTAEPIQSLNKADIHPPTIEKSSDSDATKIAKKIKPNPASNRPNPNIAIPKPAQVQKPSVQKKTQEDNIFEKPRVRDVETIQEEDIQAQNIFEKPMAQRKNIHARNIYEKPIAHDVKTDQDSIKQFLQGLNLDDKDIENKIAESIDFKQIGELFRSSIQGTLDILHSRTSIKNEMRMDVTTIRPIENNPLKFSITVEDALLRLLVDQKESYLAPQESLLEAYDDIRAHQLAVISGIQGTLNYMLARFEPKKLSTRLEKSSPISAIIPMRRQAKLWGLFEELYETIQEEAEDDFNRLFGLEFAKAYEQQIAILKKSNTN